MSLRKIAFGGAVLAALLMLTGCDDDNSKTNNYSSSGPALEIRTPSITVTGVLQDKNGNPIANHVVYLGDSADTTNAAGIFTFANVKVMSGVDINTSMDTLGSGRLVHIVVPSVEDASGNVLNLGATATLDIDKYLTSIYESADQTYFFSLDGHTVYAGAIQLPQLGATVTARLEDNATEAPIGGTAYIMVNNQAIGSNNGGVEIGNTAANTYTVVTYVEKLFSTDVNSTTGMFTVTGLPYFTTMDLLISGYSKATGAFTTYDDNVTNYDTGDIKLDMITYGDNTGLNFQEIVGAAGTGYDYSYNLDDTITAATTAATTSGLALNTFIQPSTTVTLKFLENIDTSLIDANSIKFVRTFGTEMMATIATINTLRDTVNTNNADLLALVDAFLTEKNDLDQFFAGNDGADVNTSSAAFQAVWTPYQTALNAIVTDANTSAGNDALGALSYYAADTNATIVTSAAQLVGTAGTIAADFGLIATAATDTGVELTNQVAYFNLLKANNTNYVDQTVSTVTASADTVTITLSAAPPSNNVLEIGLNQFDFRDAAGNLLTTTARQSVAATAATDVLATDTELAYVTIVDVALAE